MEGGNGAHAAEDEATTQQADEVERRAEWVVAPEEARETRGAVATVPVGIGVGAGVVVGVGVARVEVKVVLDV